MFLYWKKGDCKIVVRYTEFAVYHRIIKRLTRLLTASLLYDVYIHS